MPFRQRGVAAINREGGGGGRDPACQEKVGKVSGATARSPHRRHVLSVKRGGTGKKTSQANIFTLSFHIRMGVGVDLDTHTLGVWPVIPNRGLFGLMEPLCGSCLGAFD